jgi:putative transposase
VPYFNRKYGRSGTLWQGRYQATVIEADRYFMACCRHIEVAPVRAGVAASPAEYPWSSYSHHAGVKPDPLITDHQLYWSLGNTPFEREAAYRNLAEQALTTKEIAVLEATILRGWALGSEKFKAALEKQTKRRVSPAKRGRPLKAVTNGVV